MKSVSRLLILAALAAAAFGGLRAYRASRPGMFFPRVGTAAFEPAGLEERLKKLDEKAAKNPNDLQIIVDRGILYFFMGPDQYANALNSFNAAWRLGALDKRIFYYSGILYENLNLFSEAQKQYERFLRHEPEDREVRLRLARLLFRMDKWDDSIVHYQKLLEGNSGDVTTLVNLGLAHQERHKLLLKNPDKRTPEEKALAASDVEQGLGYLERAAHLQPDLPEKIYGGMAQLYFHKGDLEKCVAAAGSELAQNPADKKALQVLAAAYEKLDQKDKALDAYQKLFDQDPQNRAARQKVRALKAQLKIKK